jgi:Polyketide cyclase / dehydrase and lipid transport
MLVGAGALGAADEVTAVALRLHAGVAKALLGKVIAGMPGIRDYLGTLTVEPVDAERSTLTWHVDFEFSRWHPMGWIAGPFTRTFDGVLFAALDELARQMRKA